MVTVRELRKELISLGVDEEVVNTTKGKQNLMDLLSKTKAVPEDELDQLDFTTLEEPDEAEENEVEDVLEQQAVSYLSDKWDDYVMSHFLDKELDNGHPNVHGLRRVTELLLGPITTSVGTGGLVNNYLVEIQWNRDYEGLPGIGEYQSRKFSGVASATEDNTDAPFSSYLEATAETRAETRALRKALRLKTIAAEEVKREHSKPKEEETTGFDNVNISATQVSFITNKCNQLGVNLEKFVQTVGKDKLDKVTADEARGLIEDLNRFQTGNTEIPEEMKG